MNDTEHLTQQPMDMDDSPAIAPSSRSLTNASLIPQSGSETCATCGGGSSNAAPPSYVYAIDLLRKYQAIDRLGDKESS
jgi:hypothetical protein